MHKGRGPSSTDQFGEKTLAQFLPLLGMLAYHSRERELHPGAISYVGSFGDNVVCGSVDDVGDGALLGRMLGYGWVGEAYGRCGLV